MQPVRIEEAIVQQALVKRKKEKPASMRLLA